MVKLVLLIGLTLSTYSSISSAEFERHYVLDKTQHNNDLVGENRFVTSTHEDTLVDISARNGLGYNLIRSANPTVDAWLPGEQTPVLLPFNAILPMTDRSGIVINVAEMRLYHYEKQSPSKQARVSIYPVSVGRGEWATPETKAKVTGRIENPIWYPPETIRAEHAARGDILPMQVPPGPDNPLGKYLLMLDIPGYFIHGTNRRLGIGMQVTHGCIRMYPEDIEQLVKLAANDTEVTIINQTVKAGWQNNELYIEVHPPLATEDNSVLNIRELAVSTLDRATKDHPEVIIDWNAFNRIIAATKGIPEKIGYLPATVSSRFD
jgi:L,D-transpeptidase ErfK/SrfK